MSYPSGTYLYEIADPAVVRELTQYDALVQGYLQVQHNDDGSHGDITANSLDVKSRGIWTPTLTFGGGNTGITYGVQTGTYTKLSNIVIVTARIVLTAKGSSTGAPQINGLPFPGVGVESGLIDGFNLTGLTGTPYGVINASGIALAQTSATGRANLADTNFTNTTDIRVTLGYHV